MTTERSSETWTDAFHDGVYAVASSAWWNDDTQRWVAEEELYGPFFDVDSAAQCILTLANQSRVRGCILQTREQVKANWSHVKAG